ncbi:MAG: hypothetical protein OXT69_00840 [Candidatus Poribacteria bacterium]|nr:hypothetical protein [Candidatus Poribacteria bacterium]
MAKFFQRLLNTERALESVDIRALPRPDFNLERPAVAAVLDGRIPAPEHDQADAFKNALNAIYGRNLEWASYFDAVPKGCVGMKLRIVEMGAFFTLGKWTGSVRIDLEVHDFQTLPLRCFTVPIVAERPLANVLEQEAAASAWEKAAAQLIGCIDKALLAVRDGADLEAAFQPRAATALTS